MTAAPPDIKTMQLYRKVERIHNELRARGINDHEALRVEDLVALDQYHYHGTAAVDAAISALSLGPNGQVLDVGAGIGGPARYMAFKTGCRVTALELQSDLDRTAAGLTERCGLGGRVSHLCGDILSGMMDGGGFDALVSMLVFLRSTKLWMGMVLVASFTFFNLVPMYPLPVAHKASVCFSISGMNL